MFLSWNVVCFHYISLVAIQIVIIEKVTTCTANLALNYLICNVILLFYCIALIKNDKIKLYIKNGVVVATHPHFFFATWPRWIHKKRYRHVWVRARVQKSTCDVVMAGVAVSPASLLDVIAEIAEISANTGVFKKDCADLARRVCLLTHLVEEIRDSPQTPTAEESDASSSCECDWWSDLVVGLQAAKRLLSAATCFQARESSVSILNECYRIHEAFARFGIQCSGSTLYITIWFSDWMLKSFFFFFFFFFI